VIIVFGKIGRRSASRGILLQQFAQQRRQTGGWGCFDHCLLAGFEAPPRTVGVSRLVQRIERAQDRQGMGVDQVDMTVESPEGTSPSGSHRTVRETLVAYGSSCPLQITKFA